jgi:hypothetical protein
MNIDWDEVVQRIELNSRYENICSAINEGQLGGFLRGRKPFGKADGIFEQYATSYTGFWFAAEFITVLIHKGIISNTELNAELTLMMSEKNFSLLSLRYVDFYLTKYMKYKNISDFKLKLETTSLMNLYKEINWKYNDEFSQNYCLSLLESIKAEL